MDPIRILLAVEPTILRESLRRVIEQQDDMVVVEQTCDPLDILLTVELQRIDVVVISSQVAEEMPDSCSHLFAEFPEIQVVTIAMDGERAFTFRHEIKAQELGDTSVSSLIRAFRTGKTGYWDSS